MGMPSMPELLIILVIVVLLFGAKKIPELAKGVGKGIKEFKGAMKEDDEPKSEEKPKELAAKEGEAAQSETAVKETKEA